MEVGLALSALFGRRKVLYVTADVSISHNEIALLRDCSCWTICTCSFSGSGIETHQSEKLQSVEG